MLTRSCKLSFGLGLAVALTVFVNPASRAAENLDAIGKAVAAARAEQVGSTIRVNPQWTLEPSRSAEDAPSRALTSSPNTMPALSARERWLSFIGTLPECQGDLRATAECMMPPADPAAPAAARPPLAAVRSLAREVVLTLQLPDAAPRIGPDPGVNEWNMAVVGYPLWLWTEGSRTLTTTRAAYGVTFTLQATQTATRFTMGDGRVVTCATTQPYPTSAEPGTPSPACGHVYETPSLPQGTYTVSATTLWDVNWSALGYSGTLPAQLTASRELRVGELQAVLVR